MRALWPSVYAVFAWLRSPCLGLSFLLENAVMSFIPVRMAYTPVCACVLLLTGFAGTFLCVAHRADADIDASQPLSTVSSTALPMPQPLAGPLYADIGLTSVGTASSFGADPLGQNLVTPFPGADGFGELSGGSWLLPSLTSVVMTAPRALDQSALPGSDFSLLPTTSDLGCLTRPAYQDAEMRRIFNVGRIGEFTVPLRKDPGERANILLAAQFVDGLTLQPGQVFSFNDAVGVRTPERGFKEGWMFDNGRVVRGAGGGICIIATGLYNAALHAGLGMIERHPHSGIVSYAPPGCDSSIVYGSEDLKFQNTTDAPLTIRAIPQDGHVVCALFGAVPPPGYQVVVKPAQFAPIPPDTIDIPDPTLGPGRVAVDQKPQPGYTVKVVRDIVVDGRVRLDEVVAFDIHPPHDKIVRVPMTPSEYAVAALVSSLMGA